jgi:hypothetical protein
MTPSEKRTKSAVSETGQIPRHLLEAFQQIDNEQRESQDGQESGSITGIFRMKKRAEGIDAAKDVDAPSAGNSPEPAAQ